MPRSFGFWGRCRPRGTIYGVLLDELVTRTIWAPCKASELALTTICIVAVSSFVLDYPFAQRLYPRAREADAHLRTLGTPVVLSDGDTVLQPRKVQRSGLWDAFDGCTERNACSMQRRARTAAVRGTPGARMAAHFVISVVRAVP